MEVGVETTPQETIMVRGTASLSVILILSFKYIVVVFFRVNKWYGTYCFFCFPFSSLHHAH